MFVTPPMEDLGEGPAVLLLHGGGGPLSVRDFAERLLRHARVLLPTHPGFGGTPIEAGIETVADLARMYEALIQRLDLRDLTVVGVSIGGWIACELALLAPERIAQLVLVDSVGLQVPGHEVVDVFSTPRELMPKLTYHRPERFLADRAAQTLHQSDVMAANFAALARYDGGSRMQDPTLGPRLAALSVPTLALWGESDGIVSPDYGRAFAAAIPGARFALVAEAGHFPQIEQPDLLVNQVVSTLAKASATESV